MEILKGEKMRDEERKEKRSSDEEILKAYKEAVEAEPEDEFNPNMPLGLDLESEAEEDE